MSKIQDVISELRTLYPDLEIIVWQKNNKAHLLVNERTIFKFEPDFMERHLRQFGDAALKETVKIWAEYIHTRYIKRLKRFKKESGRPALALTESQIKFARNNTRSNLAASRFLNVSYNTYRKYAMMFNLFEDHKNQAGKKIPKGGRRQKVPWQEIFDNKHPNYDLLYLKRRIIDECVIEEKCEICGYSTRREFDNKISLVLDFKDGNVKNMSRDNIRFLCYNCKFNTGKRMSNKVLTELKEMYDQGQVEQEKKKTDELWNEFNPEQKDDGSNTIIQSNQEEIDDIWNKFNN